MVEVGFFLNNLRAFSWTIPFHRQLTQRRMTKLKRYIFDSGEVGGYKTLKFDRASYMTHVFLKILDNFLFKLDRFLICKFNCFHLFDNGASFNCLFCHFFIIHPTPFIGFSIMFATLGLIKLSVVRQFLWEYFGVVSPSPN